MPQSLVPLTRLNWLHQWVSNYENYSFQSIIWICSVYILWALQISSNICNTSGMMGSTQGLRLRGVHFENIRLWISKLVRLWRQIYWKDFIKNSEGITLSFTLSPMHPEFIFWYDEILLWHWDGSYCSPWIRIDERVLSGRTKGRRLSPYKHVSFSVISSRDWEMKNQSSNAGSTIE